MKAGIDLSSNSAFYVVIGIIVLLVAVLLLSTVIKTLGGVDEQKQYAINSEKKKQAESLNEQYGLFMRTDGGLDSYEASVLLAKAVEYTWKDCANFCKEETDISDFTNFFATHPIIISKALECDNAYDYEKYGEQKSEYKISKGSIKDICTSGQLGADKSEIVDEWTTTIWGLRRNSEMCTNYFADGYQWGNYECNGEAPNYKCKPNCGIGVDKIPPERTQDRIQEWSGVMVKGKAYNNIKVIYSPDCTLVLGYLPYSDIACIKVKLGGGIDSLSTTLSLDVSETKPKKGDAVSLTGKLTDGYGNHISGKQVKIMTLETVTTSIIGTYTTDSQGSYSAEATVGKCGEFEVQSKFDGEGMHKSSESSKITITPSGGGC